MKPLKFEPLLKSTIWGGNKIIAFKHLDIKQEKVGESWEISGVPGNESIVADGEMKGKKLNEVVAELKENFLGAENYKRFGNEFPLLIKFIDANTDLSIQVHPNDEIVFVMRKLYFVNCFSMFCASQPYVCLLRYLPRFSPKITLKSAEELKMNYL